MKASIPVLAAAIAAAAIAPVAAQARPRVEVVFALDSTGSMGGLIEGAKLKIWSIANRIADASPRPEIRIGLVAYRDLGDDYVTRLFDLSDDIDSVYLRLRSIQADGGGDGEESVNQALDEAVTRFEWSRDPSVAKVIFLVGDYPPHMDYAQDVKYSRSCAEAVKRGIRINTVQCGSLPETAAVWKEIARLARGEYAAIAQSGNMVDVASPYDGDIARISVELSATVVAYGSLEEQAHSMEKARNATEAPASVAADRAAYNLSSGGRAIQGRGDLVADMEEGLVELSGLKEAELPPEMRKMSARERAAYIDAQAKKRVALNAALVELSAKRDAYLEAEQARLAASSGGDAFDAKVQEIIARQMR